MQNYLLILPRKIITSKSLSLLNWKGYKLTLPIKQSLILFFES